MLEHLQVTVDWQSNFDKLANSDDQDIKDRFRKGLSLDKILNRQKKAKVGQDPVTAFEVGSKMLLSVEKRARKLLVRHFEDYEDFLQDLSTFLHAFLLRDATTSSDVQVGAALERTLTSPLQFSSSSVNSSTSSANHFVALCFGVDDAIYRVLAHAVCQFYGIACKSEDVVIKGQAAGGNKSKKGKHRNQLRQFKIHMPKNEKDLDKRMAGMETVSLCSFLTERRELCKGPM